MSTLTYIIISYCISLRGSEGFLFDLGGLRKLREKSSEHCIMVLQGGLKGKYHDLQHLIPCCNRTGTGINVRGTLDRLIELKRSANLVNGPAISTVEGKVLSSKAIDDILHSVLIDIFLTDYTLFKNVICISISCSIIIYGYLCC